MIEYFVVIHGLERQGPFHSIGGACRFLVEIAKCRGYTQEQADHFFVHQSVVEQSDTTDGNAECFRLDWLAREKSRREMQPADPVAAYRTAL